jgi:hypothetical protein
MGHPDGQFMLSSQTKNAANMVTMLVGDNDPRQV